MIGEALFDSDEGGVVFGGRDISKRRYLKAPYYCEKIVNVFKCLLKKV